LSFRDRKDAGLRLAEHLERFREKRCAVIAIPRGGVVVGYYVAERLGCPMDVTVPRKVGAPMEPELAVGAVAEDGTLYVEEEVARMVGVGEEWLKEAAERELQEVKRRIEVYRDGKPLPSLEGYTVIVVDDGVATGATMIATVRFLRKLKPKKVVIAVPVAPPEILGKLRAEAEEVVCVETPSPFYAIGQFYRDFTQVSDAEVMKYLAMARRLTA